MLDEVAGASIGFIGRIIGYLIIEFFFEIFCCFVGRVFLSIITLGQYKKIIKTESNGNLESFVGLAAIIAFIVYLVL